MSRGSGHRDEITDAEYERAQAQDRRVDELQEQGNAQALVQFLHDPDEIVRERAVKAIGQVGSVKEAPLLLHHLHERNPLMRQEAIEALEESIRFDPSVGAYHVLGSAYLRLGNREAAEQSFQKAIRMRPSDFKSHAGIHLDMGKLF